MVGAGIVLRGRRRSGRRRWCSRSCCLAVNWFGDSLDGTLARVRQHERPRYGFYVDHVLDAVGILFVVGGLFAGGFASILPAAALSDRLLPAEHRDRAGHARARHVPDLVLEVRTDRAPAAAGGGHAAAAQLAVEHDRRTSLPAVRHRPGGRGGRDPDHVRRRSGAEHEEALRAGAAAAATGSCRKPWSSARASQRGSRPQAGQICVASGFSRKAAAVVDMIHLMVLAAVDDLLFSSKIRATAKQAGVELIFARSPQEVLDQAKAQKPALVIFDLNSGKTDPVATIAALKADPALSAIARPRVRVARAHRAHRLGAERGRRSGAAAVRVRGQPRRDPAVLAERSP